MTDKKEHIINAAVDLFARKGFEGTSVRDLATAADVNIAMINYYFGSKEKLFETMLERKSSYTRGILDEISNNASLSEIEKIDAIVESYVSRLFTGRTFHRVIHQEMMLNEREALQQTIVNILFPNSLIIKNIIEGGIKKGVFKKVDAALTIATLIGTINQILLSRRMCNKLINKEENYIPYEDAKFKKRVSDHIKQLMHEHLLTTPVSSKK
jgi:AcrR family transcriptional regulator